MPDPMHPASLNTLRQLLKLHGAAALVLVIRQLQKEQNKTLTSPPQCLTTGTS